MCSVLLWLAGLGNATCNRCYRGQINKAKRAGSGEAVGISKKKYNKITIIVIVLNIIHMEPKYPFRFSTSKYYNIAKNSFLYLYTSYNNMHDIIMLDTSYPYSMLDTSCTRQVYLYEISYIVAVKLSWPISKNFKSNFIHQNI